MKKFEHITIAGTFDRLHAGHTSFIEHAFNVAEKVSIAITAEDFPHTKLLQNIIEPYDVRKKTLAEYISQKKYTKRSAIIPIHDFYGFALEDTTLDGILVTRDTRKNAVRINEKRKKLGIKKLRIIMMPFIKGADRRIIKSSRIRAGEIDRSGKTYVSNFSSQYRLTLPEHMRKVMRNPLGKIFADEKKTIDYLNKIKPSMVITVGDVVTASLKEQGYLPDIEVVDFKTRRKKLSRLFQTPHASSRLNKAGTLQRRAVLTFQKYVRNFVAENKKHTIFIKGEEDLLALPAILFAPLNSAVLYGQFEMGIVVTQVTEELKAKVEQFIQKFS